VAPSSAGSATVGAAFAAGWRMTLTTFWQGVVVAIALGSALALVGGACASRGWVRRNQRVVLDAEFLLAAGVHALGAFADVFFWLLVCLCGYWYIFFKRQQAAFLMLPDEADCGVVVLLLALCLVGKGVTVLSTVYRQGRADVFLIDWETAHGTLLGKGGEPADEAPVSVWRALFIANELNELQAVRLVKPALSLFLVLLFMVVLDFEGKYATAVPGGGGAAALAAAPSHLLLRFAVGSFVYLCVLGAQALVTRLVYVPYVEDKVGQLVDLLAVANVSALILTEPLCGYYLHGRSVHAHADASMLELHEQLRAEEDGLTAHRGLTPSSAVQTFQVGRLASEREEGRRAEGARAPCARPPPCARGLVAAGARGCAAVSSARIAWSRPLLRPCCPLRRARGRCT
jgi:meckelin